MNSTILDSPWHLVIQETIGQPRTCSIQVMENDRKPIATVNLGRVDIELGRHLVECHNIWLASLEQRRI
jgi:hypothetical protein